MCRCFYALEFCFFAAAMHFFAVVVVAAVGDAAFVRCSFFFSLIVRMSVSRRLTLRIHFIVNSQLEWTTAFGWTPPSLVFMYSELVGTSLKNGIAQRYHSHVFYSFWRCIWQNAGRIRDFFDKIQRKQTFFHAFHSCLPFGHCYS